MKTIMKYLAVLLLVSTLTPSVFAQNLRGTKTKFATVYIFGVGTNFADSTAYFTSVQRLDSALLERSQDYLIGRQYYSDQLNRYLMSQAEKTNETCCVFFATSRAKTEKLYLKVRRRMVKERGQKNIIELPVDAFRFRVLSYGTNPGQK